MSTAPRARRDRRISLQASSGRRRPRRRGRAAVRAIGARDPDDPLARRPCPRSHAPASAAEIRPRLLPRHRLARTRRRALAPRRAAAPRASCPATDLDALAAGSSSRLARALGRRGAALSFHAMSGKVAPPAETSRALRRRRRTWRSATSVPPASTCSPAARSRRSSGARSRRRARRSRRRRLALGIYLALVIREVVAGDGDVLWGLLWREGRPSGSSSRPRSRCSSSRRPGSTASASCVRAGAGSRVPDRRRAHRARVRHRDGLRLLDLGSDPDAVVVVSALAIGLRAAYESASLEVMRAAGVRSRVVLVGAGESPRLERALAAARAGSRTSSSASSRPRRPARPPPARLPRRAADVLERCSPTR